MANIYVIDTHALLWYLVDDPKLGTKAGHILDDNDNRFLLPVIALSEALFILEKKPDLYKLTIAQLLQKVTEDSRIKIIELDYLVVVKTLECQLVTEMHDRQIVATALLAQTAEVQVAILTKDPNIATSGLIPTIW